MKSIIQLLLPLYAFFSVSCGNKTIEVKDVDGQFTEKYTVNNKNEKDGMYESRYIGGELFEKSTYKAGKLSGERIIYYKNGQPEIIETYTDDGLLNGPYRTYYEDGTLKSEKIYVKNMLQGMAKVFHPNGQIKEVVNFTDNMEQGEFVEYHPNGKLQWKGTYLNGNNEFGLLEEYDSTGLLIKKMMCDSQAVCRTIWKPGMPDIQQNK